MKCELIDQACEVTVVVIQSPVGCLSSELDLMSRRESASLEKDA